MSLLDIGEKIRKILNVSTQNLRAWGQVATQPKLRQEYTQRVAKPAIKKASAYIPYTSASRERSATQRKQFQRRPAVQRAGAKVGQYFAKRPATAQFTEQYLQPYKNIYSLFGGATPKHLVTAKKPATTREKIAAGVGGVAGHIPLYALGGKLVEAPLAARIPATIAKSKRLAKIAKFATQSAASTPFVSTLTGKGTLKERIKRAPGETGADVAMSALMMGALKPIRKAIPPIKIKGGKATTVKIGALPEVQAPYKQARQLLEEKLKPQIQGKGKQSFEDIITQARKGIGKQQPTKKAAKRTLKQFYTDWVNRFQPIEEAATKIEKEKGINIIPKFSPKYTIKQLLGSGGTAGLRHKQKLQPILDQVDNLKISTDDFDVFLKAKRDVGFGEVGRAIKGSDPIKAQGIIDALGQKYDGTQLENIANQFYQYQDNGLKMLQEAGFIDQAGYDAIKAGNKYYVPFERVMDTVDDYLGMPTKKAQQAAQPIKKIKGSIKQIISPTESIIANTYKVEAAVAKNRVAKSLVDLRKIAPEYADLFETAKKSSDSTVSVWENGKKNFYEVGNEIARAVKGLNEESMGTLTKILSAPARLLRQGATGRNIDFMIPNVFKDQLDAAVSSEYGYKPFLDYFRGLGHLMNWKRTGSDELVEQYLKSGGSIFFENMSGRKAIREQIAEATVKPGMVKRFKNWALGGIEAIGEISETPTRLGLFKRGMEKTSNPLLAAYESREGTLDFARMGAKMKTANAITPFLNVGVQGFDKLVRNIKERPGKMALNMAIYGGLPATMVALYNNLYHPQELSAIPDWEKETNFIIITGTSEDGAPQYIKFPKGNIVPYIANPIENFIAWAAGNSQQSFTQMALNVFSEGLPILKGGGTPKEILSRTIGGLLPQAGKPPLEDIANYSFFRGKDIVPSYLKSKPAHQQAFKYTPEVYKALGKIVNVSPLKAKNFLEGYLAGYIKVPVNLVEVIKDISEGNKPDTNQIPVLRRFIGESYTTVKDAIKIKAEEKPTSRFATKATEGIKISLPASTEDLSVLYKDAQGTIDRYGAKRLKIEHGLISSDVEDVKADVDKAIALKKRIEKERPDQVFDIHVDTYKSGGGQNVESRAKWVAGTLEGLDGKERQEMINRLWDDKVITKGAKGVATKLEAMGIDVWGYTGTGKGGITTKKAKKPKKVSYRKISIPKVRISGKIGSQKISPIKIAKPPAMKTTTRKATRISMPTTALPTIKISKPKGLTVGRYR